ncbi:MAG TPA: hypothetical protein PLL92_14455 [Alicycliphilus sp.]|nr:hypothetical protein [Alicycliphilus sp.]
MPKKQQRRTISPFDARSVLLFAALTMGGALAQAQTSAAPATQSRHQAKRSPAAPGPLLITDARARSAQDGAKRRA